MNREYYSKLEHYRKRIFYIDAKPLGEDEVAEYIKEVQRQLTRKSDILQKNYFINERRKGRRNRR